MLDHERFVVLFEALCATFRVKVSEALLEGYWLGLEDIETRDFERAIARAIREKPEHMPRPAELRRLSGEQSAEERAVLAWATVRAAIGSVGTYRSISFVDPAINAAIRAMGGWTALGALAGDAFDTWAQKDFVRQYVAWVGLLRDSNVEQARALPGRSELESPIGTPVELVRFPTLGEGAPVHEMIARPPLRELDGGDKPPAVVAALAHRLSAGEK